MRNSTKIVNPQNCRPENKLVYLPDTTAGTVFTLQLYRCVAEIKKAKVEGGCGLVQDGGQGSEGERVDRCDPPNEMFL